MKIDPRLLVFLAFVIKSLGDATSKYIREDGVPTSQLVCYRFAFGLIALPFLLRLSRQPAPTYIKEGADTWRLVWRGLLGMVSVYAQTFVSPFLSLSDARAISYINPLLFAVFGWWVFKEQIPRLRLFALLLGFSGVLVVASPTQGVVSNAALLLLAGGAAAAWSDVQVKILQRSGHATSTILYWFFTVSLLGALPLALIEAWSMPTWTQIAPLTIFLISSLLFQYFYTEALTRLAASEAAPYQYTTHIWFFLIDTVVWQIVPDVHSIVGTLLILGDGFICYYLARQAGTQVLKT